MSVPRIGLGFVFHAFNFVYTVGQTFGKLSSRDFTALCKDHRWPIPFSVRFRAH